MANEISFFIEKKMRGMDVRPEERKRLITQGTVDFCPFVASLDGVAV
jgi:hypothetical protein